MMTKKSENPNLKLGKDINGNNAWVKRNNALPQVSAHTTTELRSVMQPQYPSNIMRLASRFEHLSSEEQTGVYYALDDMVHSPKDTGELLQYIQDLILDSMVVDTMTKTSTTGYFKGLEAAVDSKASTVYETKRGHSYDEELHVEGWNKTCDREAGLYHQEIVRLVAATDNYAQYPSKELARLANLERGCTLMKIDFYESETKTLEEAKLVAISNTLKHWNSIEDHKERNTGLTTSFSL